MTKSENVVKLKAKILEKRPILKELLKQHASVSIHQYSQTLSKTVTAVDETRKKDFIEAVALLAAKYFSKEIVASIIKQLTADYFVSTAEHHGPLTHPFFVHSNLLASFEPQENILVLATGNVSLNNSSYPRGIIFHSPGGAQHRLPFFTSPERMSPVFGHRAFNLRDLERAQNLIKEKVTTGKLSETFAIKVANLVQEIYGQKVVLDLPDYNSQIVKTNSLLWQKLFPNKDKQRPNLITLQLEDVVLELLQKHHLFFRTEINELLFNPELHTLLEQYTQDIPGNFSLGNNRGTFLFWALPKGQARKQQLFLQNKNLVSKEGFTLPLEPEALAQAIEWGELIPSTFLSLLLLSEYYGVKCLGGFSQGTYLTAMHHAYNKMLGRDGDLSFNVSHSSGLRSDFVLAHFLATDNNLYAASGIDLAAHSTELSEKIFFDNINQLTLEQAMAPLFPELYTILYSESERDKDLLAVTASDIIEHYGITKKVKPAIEI